MCLPSKVSGSTIQSIALAIGNLLCLNFGLMFGITPAHMRLYQTLETPLNNSVDASGAIWLTLHLFLSAALAALLAGWISHRIGPKSVLLMCGLLQITAWFCIHFAYDIVHIYASRIFEGCAGGAAFVVLPLFINEITDSKDKVTRLALTIDIGRSLGVFIGLIFGFYLDYDYVSIVGVCISCVFSVTFPFVQESPYYYVRKGDVANMEKSLRWFRGIRHIDDRSTPEFVREVNDFKELMQEKSQEKALPLRCYFGCTIVCSVLIVASYLSGLFGVLSFEKLFIDELFIEETLTISLASAFLLGTILTRSIVPQVSKKCVILVITTLGSIFSMSAFALLKCGVWQTELNSLPLGFLALNLIFVSFVGPLAAVIINEVVPTKIRHLVPSAVAALAWILLFCLIMALHKFAYL